MNFCHAKIELKYQLYKTRKHIISNENKSKLYLYDRLYDVFQITLIIYTMWYMSPKLKASSTINESNVKKVIYINA